MNDDVTRASKFLAYVLRHDPVAIGLVPGEGGWVRIDLSLEPRQPPPARYHGTIARFLDSIFADGLRPGARTHVHLSASPRPQPRSARAAAARSCCSSTPSP